MIPLARPLGNSCITLNLCTLVSKKIKFTPTIVIGDHRGIIADLLLQGTSNNTITGFLVTWRSMGRTTPLSTISEALRYPFICTTVARMSSSMSRFVQCLSCSWTSVLRNLRIYRICTSSTRRCPTRRNYWSRLKHSRTLTSFGASGRTRWCITKFSVLCRDTVVVWLES